MAVTIDEIAQHLTALDFKFVKKGEDKILLAMAMPTYRGPEGEDYLRLVIRLSEEGRYFELFAPFAFRALGPYVNAFLRACAIIQFRTKLVQFEYDDSDGEIRPVIEFPIEDGTLTAQQLKRCIMGMCRLVESYYPVLKKALEEGVVDLPAGLEEARVIETIFQAMLGHLPLEQRRQVLEHLKRSISEADADDKEGGEDSGSESSGGSTPPWAF